MITLEMVEKLREKTGVSYADAKRALEETDGDMLDAIVLLENEAKIPPPPQGGAYTSRQEGAAEAEARPKTAQARGMSFGELCGRFFRWIGRVIQRGNVNHLVVSRGGEVYISLPATALVLMIVCVFWLTVPLIIIGMFMGFTYEFRGPDLGREDVNRVMNKAQEAAEDIKRDITEEK